MLNFALIGCGNAAHFHAEVITAMNHKISAVSARPSSSRISDFARKYNAAYTYERWQDMIRKEAIDALIVAVSWDQTELIADEIIKTGIPCLIEKPVALSSERLERIISDTVGVNKKVLVAYNRRFYDFVPQLKKAIEAGRLVSIELNFPEAAELMIKKFGRGILNHVLLYMTSHWLDLLLYLIGEVKIHYLHKWKSPENDTYSAYNGILYSLRYDVPIHLQINFNSPSQTSMTFNFTDAIYKLCPMEILTVYRGIECIEPDSKVKIRRYMPKVSETCITGTDFKPGFYSQMQNFINICVTGKEKNTAGATLNDAMRVTKLCEQIRG